MAFHCIVQDDEELFISRHQYSSLSSMLAGKLCAIEGATVAHVGHGGAAAHVMMPVFRWEPQAGALVNARPPRGGRAAGTPAIVNAKYHRLRRKSTRLRGVSKNHVLPLVSVSRPVADHVSGSKAHSGSVVLYPSVFSQGPESSRAGTSAAAGSRSIVLLQSSRATIGSSKGISHASHALSLPETRFLHTVLLNADRQSFETEAMATSTSYTGVHGGNSQILSDKTFKKQVMGRRSRLSQMNGQKRRVQGSRQSLDRNEEESKEEVPGDRRRPLSSRDFAHSSPVLRSFSDQSFRARSRGQSLAHGTHGSLAVGSLGREKSKSLHVTQYQMSINAMAYFCTDDDDNNMQPDGHRRGPSEVAWHQAEEQEYNNPKHPVVQARIRAHDEDQPKPCAARGTHERWTFNSRSSSWNLSLVQKPTSKKQLSAGSGCMALNWHRRRQSATMRPRIRNLKLLAKDFLASVSRKSDRNVEKLGTKSRDSPAGSGRSRWRAMRSSWKRRLESSSSGGPSEIDGSDSDEPKIVQVTSIVDGLEEAQDEAQADKSDFQFDSRPVASSSVSDTTDRHRIKSADRRIECIEAQQGPANKDMIPPRNMRGDDLVEVQCSYHNAIPHVADARSSPDSDVDSLKWSLIRENSAASDQSDAQWVPSRNCRYYVKEMLDRSLAFSSSRAFGGNSAYGKTGRFRIDLEGGPRLEYKPADRPTTGPPDVPLRITKTGRRASFYNRVMLSPCMPFLERRRKQSKNGRRRIPASFAAGVPTCTRSNAGI